jgi:sugar lactone lactonase YvrE
LHRPTATLVVALSSLVVGSRAMAAPNVTRAVGDTTVFAQVAYPGHPGGLAVDGNTVNVDTIAPFDRLFDPTDDIFAYDVRDGTLAPGRPNPIAVTRMMPVADEGLGGLALDGQGRLYAADMNGRIVRIDPATGAAAVYATFPTNTYSSFSNMPGFLVFDRDGNLYTGDSAGAPVIWRIPPGGGPAEPWFVDPRLAGTWAGGVIGLTIDSSGENLYFAGGSQQQQIVLYRLPLSHPDAQHLAEFHRYSDVVAGQLPVFGAGGIAFGKSGKLYVTLFAKDQVSILNPDGTEQLRFPSADDNGKRDIPYYGPFDLAFNGLGSLLVSNSGANTFGYGPAGTDPPGGLATSNSWVIFDVFVDDTANPLARPLIP